MAQGSQVMAHGREVLDRPQGPGALWARTWAWTWEDILHQESNMHQHHASSLHQPSIMHASIKHQSACIKHASNIHQQTGNN